MILHPSFVSGAIRSEIADYVNKLSKLFGEQVTTNKALTSMFNLFRPLLLSPLKLPLDIEPLVSNNPLSSLRRKAVSDHVELDGGESIV